MDLEKSPDPPVAKGACFPEHCPQTIVCHIARVQKIPSKRKIKTMKIVITPDSFKENLTSLEVATAIEKGIKRVLPGAKCIKVPMADGGEGTVQSVMDATAGKLLKKEVVGPLGEPVPPNYGGLGDGKTAVIEMAEASGSPL